MTAPRSPTTWTRRSSAARPTPVRCTTILRRGAGRTPAAARSCRSSARPYVSSGQCRLCGSQACRMPGCSVPVSGQRATRGRCLPAGCQHLPDQHCAPLNPHAAPATYVYVSSKTSTTYLLNTTAVGFVQAEMSCNDQGGHLVTYANFDEQQEVEQVGCVCIPQTSLQRQLSRPPLQLHAARSVQQL